MLNFHIISLFPEFFESPLAASLLGKARQKGIVNFDFHNPRIFGFGKHAHVDDRPFGGGPGMIMQVEPLLRTIQSIDKPGRIILLSPAGRQLDQALARELAQEKDLTLICGRYEGVDARLGDFAPIEEVSLCPAVLNGGETPALAIIEAVSRFIPGFLGKDESSQDESFAEHLLEYPQYTRPEDFEGRKAPAVLLNGNHKEIASWRRQQSLAKTLALRPEMLDDAMLDRHDAAFLASQPRLRPGRSLSFCLCHWPVKLEDGIIGCSSLTNLDIHDIARISRSYGMGPFYVLMPLEDQRDILQTILRHWQLAENGHRDHKAALEIVRPAENFRQIEDHARQWYGKPPVWLATSATWHAKKGEKPLTPADARAMCAAGPVIICLGTARGLHLPSMDIECGQMRPLRYLDENHLSVRSAAAILADRILGDYY